jgi:hypothetical protein
MAAHLSFPNSDPSNTLRIGPSTGLRTGSVAVPEIEGQKLPLFASFPVLETLTL